MTLNLKIYAAILMSALPIMYFFGTGIDKYQRNQEWERIRLRTPIGMGAILPASSLELYKHGRCGIESIVVAIPHARGGKEFTQNGYLYNCYWQVGNDMHVEDQLGKHRIIPMDRLFEIFPEE